MTYAHREVVCTVRHALQADKIVELLEAARFDRDTIQVIYPDDEPVIRLSVEILTETDFHLACESCEEAGAENIAVLPRFDPALFAVA